MPGTVAAAARQALRSPPLACPSGLTVTKCVSQSTVPRCEPGAAGAGRRGFRAGPGASARGRRDGRRILAGSWTWPICRRSSGSPRARCSASAVGPRAGTTALDHALKLCRVIERSWSQWSGLREANWLRPSQLQVKDALYLLSRIGTRGRSFVDELVGGRNVLEIGSGGHTALVQHLLDLPEPARAVLAIDLVDLQEGADGNLYERMDIDEMVARRADIRSKLRGSLPDTIIGTSLFGASTLSIDVTRRWIEQCIGVAAPGGVIVADFLETRTPDRWLARILFCATTVRRPRFENLLEELRRQGCIRCWISSEKPGRRIRYKKGHPRGSRPRSVTYQITINGKRCGCGDADDAVSGPE